MRLLFGVSLKTAVKNFSKNKILKNKSRTRNVQDLTSLSKVVATTYDTSSFQKSVLYDPNTLIEIHFLVWDGGKIMREKMTFFTILPPSTHQKINFYQRVWVIQNAFLKRTNVGRGCDNFWERGEVLYIPGPGLFFWNSVLEKKFHGSFQENNKIQSDHFFAHKIQKNT